MVKGTPTPEMSAMYQREDSKFAAFYSPNYLAGFAKILQNNII
ncbi:hypothetical protein T4B_5181 [Trichinella pseudospiralis]|uniref:Uncharacterized protein n=1 Tax=Trichinella pseudospiralis TaxID=6337 RepID=A0A0V1DRB7_TRIPS|nr:hypothetical protein T4A_9933 [Trichinella pseudospiralis]KRY99829.1 hypothetical protein T4B_5181 [Trichinella pseudospiralis]